MGTSDSIYRHGRGCGGPGRLCEPERRRLVGLKGVHAVDGYWVTWEQPCEPATHQECRTAIETATSILHTTEPAAEYAT